MKVDVLQVQDAKFAKLSWWSYWVDVCLYDTGSCPYLLQMSISRRNKKRFRSVRLTGTIVYRQALSSTIGNLTQMEAKQ